MVIGLRRIKNTKDHCCKVKDKKKENDFIRRVYALVFL